MTSAGAEAALIEAARRGASEAFSRLVDMHQQAVRGFLRRACADGVEADDLAQETFVTAWARIGGFRGQSSFRVWLCGVAWRKTLTHLRARGRAGRREAEWLETQDPPEGSADRRLDISVALSQLPPEQRAAVALCLAGDFSHAEAAEALGLPLGTVKSHVARGRARLLQLLGAADDRC